ncbi:MAG: NosD domain-containing protein [Bacteroidota bacterium]|nr:NosD domain-containing protein [Bacteroidota bacterium]
MKKITLLSFVLMICTISNAQTYLDLTDDMDISSNSYIVINPGNYSIQDAGNDGLIRINGQENIIIDGSGVNADGIDTTGYLIKIDNASNVEIRNFASASLFYYAVYITNSDSIMIHHNDFSYNKVNYSGWISIWTNYQSALGGGVMMYLTDYAEIHDNNMRFQNDGVALYHCDSIQLWDNNFSWNTSFGIRMYWTDHCYIHHNNCSHVNRPYTNPSDCAALLVLVSNENLVEHNDLSYSGDGIFLGQFEHSNIPNNNIFRYNECSHSPHNAIEATFADGNIFLRNNCNYSHYGLWLGYSYNTVVDSNEVIGNQHSGIAIDRGFNNTITNNDINENPIGIELWEGDGIPPYQNQYSHDYYIMNNHFEGNELVIQADNTEHMLVVDNEFQYNNHGILLNGDTSEDTISQNNFFNTCFYHIENQSTHNIYAKDNQFFASDENFIECNIYDQNDDPAKGEVIWHPFTYGNIPVLKTDLVEDMAEEPAKWYAYPEACWWWDSTLATSVSWDYTDKMVGAASVFCETGNGWDLGLQYWPAGDTIILWSLNEQDTLKFWLKTANNTGYGFQFYHVRVGNNCGGFYRYGASSSVLNNAMGIWRQVSIPLAGGGSPNYSRSEHGDVSLDEISYVSVHADTWEYGFEIWLDGMHFTSTATQIHGLSREEKIWLSNFPNPFKDQTTIAFNLPMSDHVRLAVYELSGSELMVLKDEWLRAGLNKVVLSKGELKAGIYFYQLRAGSEIISRKLIVN